MNSDDIVLQVTQKVILKGDIKVKIRNLRAARANVKKDWQ